MTQFSSIWSNHRKQALEQGFTLIELLIVLSIMVVLSGIGIVSVRGFTESQNVKQTVNSFTTAIELAKSRAQTQVKPSTVQCATAPLDGYKITFSCASTPCTNYTNFAVHPVCGNQESAATYKETLPGGVTVSTPSSSYLFLIFSGTIKGLTGSQSIQFSNASGTRQTVKVYGDGRYVVD